MLATKQAIFRTFTTMLKIKAYGMMLLYVLLSVGVWVHQHQCCHGKEATLINGIEVAGEACCTSDSDCQKSCNCDGETEYFSVDDEHQLVSLDFSSFLLSRWALQLEHHSFFESQLEPVHRVSSDQHRGPPLYRLNACPLHYG